MEANSLQQRLDALSQMQIMDTPAEQGFDDITALTASILGTPIALVSLLDATRQWFKSRVGLEATETPIESAFCAHAIKSGNLLEVPDAHEDQRFRDNPLVTGAPHIRFYAGMPINNPQGVRLGTLCAIDSRPRRLDTPQKHTLARLARLVEQLLVLRIENIEKSRQRRLLTQQQAINQQLLDSVMEGVVSCDDKGRLTLFNDTAKQWHGADIMNLPMEQWANCYDLFEEDGITPLASEKVPLMRALQGELVRNSGMCINAKDQPPRFIEASGGPLHGRDGRITGAVIVMHDITEKRRVDLLKRNFIASVSHELRTPLTSISGAISLIQGGAAGSISETGQKMLAIAQSNSKRLNHLINDLLDLERLELGQMRLIARPQPLLPIIQSACEANQGYAADFNVTLQISEPTVNPLVDVDANRLLQVMDNYLSNAIKFSTAGGTVNVQSQQQGNRVIVRVIDQGIGIAPEHHASLFQRFSQVDSSSSRKRGGTGLGLSITRELVARMGGTTGFESEPGKGSSFWFTLPISEPNAIGAIHAILPPGTP